MCRLFSCLQNYKKNCKESSLLEKDSSRLAFRMSCQRTQCAQRRELLQKKVMKVLKNVRFALSLQSKGSLYAISKGNGVRVPDCLAAVSSIIAASMKPLPR